MSKKGASHKTEKVSKSRQAPLISQVHFCYTMYIMKKGEKIMKWEDLPEIDQLAQIYSDQYKDAYGFRPRGTGHPETVEEYKEKLDYLSGVIHEQVKEEKALEREAFGEWKVNIRNIMNICSCSKAEAIKIDIDANDPTWSIKDYGVQDQIVEEYIWKTRIGWDKQTEIMELLNA